MHAKNDVKLDDIGACTLTFEAINEDNPLTTNQTIATIANLFHTFSKFGKVHAPICISCSHFNVNEHFNESIQIHVLKMFP